MTSLQQVLEQAPAPGAVALLARGDEVEVAAVGSVDVEGSAAMGRDTLFRIASVTKPIVAAAVLTLVDDGTLALTDPVARWLPELADPVVLRTPSSPVDDVVPAVRPVTVEDLLSSRAGWGYPADFSLPVVGLLAEQLGPGSAMPLTARAGDQQDEGARHAARRFVGREEGSGPCQRCRPAPRAGIADTRMRRLESIGTALGVVLLIAVPSTLASQARAPHDRPAPANEPPARELVAVADRPGPRWWYLQTTQQRPDGAHRAPP